MGSESESIGPASNQGEGAGCGGEGEGEDDGEKAAIAAVLREGCTLVLRDGKPVAEALWAAGGGGRQKMLCPLRCDQAVTGVLVMTAQAAPVLAEDMALMAMLGDGCGPLLRAAQAHEQATGQGRWNSVLLQVARRIFEKLDSVEEVVTKIIVHAVALLDCARCSLFMVDKASNELYARVFDADADTSAPRPKPPEIRFPIGVGIAGHVAKTGEVLNIPDAYQDPRFNSEIDKLTGFVTKNILCMPIFSPTQEVIGVAQLVNKATGPFEVNDERLFEALAVYCGLGIQAVRMVEESRMNAYRAQVTLDVLSYHSRATPQECADLMRLTVPSGEALGLYSFAFDPLAGDDDSCLLAVLRMFMDLGFMDSFRIPRQTLCQWVLTVRKSYRSVTYHNWRHALGVTHCVFAMIALSDLRNQLTDMEQLSLLVSALCHDLDHRGTNNSFQGLVGNALSQLYSTSIMEHHHFDQCLMILNCNNILCNMDGAQYQTLIQMLEQDILATDLAVHLKTRSVYRAHLEQGTFNWALPAHRVLLRSMLMTAGDLSAIIKPFQQQRRTAEIVYAEFFEQGDAERRLGHNPSSVFNRSKVQALPKMQLGFIDFVCLPVYDMLATHFSTLHVLPDAIRANRAQWEKLQGAYHPTEAALCRHLASQSLPGDGTADRKREEASARAAAEERMEQSKSVGGEKTEENKDTTESGEEKEDSQDEQQQTGGSKDGQEKTGDSKQTAEEAKGMIGVSQAETKEEGQGAGDESHGGALGASGASTQAESVTEGVVAARNRQTSSVCPLRGRVHSKLCAIL